MTKDDLSTRVAQILYGDGTSLQWARAVELADLVIWAIESDHAIRAPYCSRCGVPHAGDCLRGGDA